MERLSAQICAREDAGRKAEGRWARWTTKLSREALWVDAEMTVLNDTQEKYPQVSITDAPSFPN